MSFGTRSHAAFPSSTVVWAIWSRRGRLLLAAALELQTQWVQVQVSLQCIHQPQSRDIGTPFQAQVLYHMYIYIYAYVCIGNPFKPRYVPYIYIYICIHISLFIHLFLFIYIYHIVTLTLSERSYSCSRWRGTSSPGPSPPPGPIMVDSQSFQKS